jgi:hypothetical protein
MAGVCAKWLNAALENLLVGSNLKNFSNRKLPIQSDDAALQSVRRDETGLRI